MNIDWSKAPEWATEYSKAKGGPAWSSESGYCFIGGGFFCGGFGSMCHPYTGDYPRYAFTVIERRPWSGEGLPPVGTVCELNRFSDAPESQWHEVRIVAHIEDARLTSPVAVFIPTSGVAQSDQANAKCFRPIRTPEQIAADERESYVNGMLSYDALGGSRKGLAEALYDAGYRLQVKP